MLYLPLFFFQHLIILFSCYLSIQPFSYILLYFVPFSSSCWFVLVHSPLICWLNFLSLFWKVLFDLYCLILSWNLFWICFVLFCSSHLNRSFYVFPSFALSLVIIDFLIVIQSNFPSGSEFLVWFPGEILILPQTSYTPAWISPFSSVMMSIGIFGNLFTFQFQPSLFSSLGSWKMVM